MFAARAACEILPVSTKNAACFLGASFCNTSVVIAVDSVLPGGNRLFLVTFEVTLRHKSFTGNINHRIRYPLLWVVSGCVEQNPAGCENPKVCEIVISFAFSNLILFRVRVSK